MALPEAEDISALIFWLAWTLLYMTNRALKHGQYDTIFPSEDAIRSTFNAAKLKFAAGLLEVLQSDSPPTIDYFKTLSTSSESLWAVYLLVLEKVGQRPRTYTGSGTNASGRVRSRMSTYDKRIRTGEFDPLIPRYVERSLQEGFTITHKGYLVWAPMPGAFTAFAYRCLFLLLESVFSLAFWTMLSRDKDYFMPYLCPWPRSAFTYDGLCTHFSIFESADRGRGPIVLPDDPRTPEEIEAVEKERDPLFKQMNVARFHAYKARVFEAQTFKCDICVVTFACNAKLIAHNEGDPHLYKAGLRTRVLKGRGGSQSNTLSKKWYCETCEYVAPSEKRLKIHVNGVRHAKKLRILGLSDSTSP